LAIAEKLHREVLVEAAGRSVLPRRQWLSEMNRRHIGTKQLMRREKASLLMESVAGWGKHKRTKPLARPTPAVELREDECFSKVKHGADGNFPE